MTKKILVLGAGELGLAVLEALAKHPSRHKTSVSVLVRQSSLDSAAPDKKKRSQHLKALGIGFEAADIEAASVSDLASVFKPYDTVVSCTGMYSPPGTQTKITDAVLEAGVGRFFPWQYGMDYDVIGAGSSQDLFDEQLEVRAKIRAQEATKWTIVSTGLFMSFLFIKEFAVVDVEDKIVRGLGTWENKLTLTTPEDIGRVVADVVLDPREYEQGSQVVYTAGDTLSYKQIADVVESHFGVEFTRELWDRETTKKHVQEDPNNALVKYRDTFAEGRGVSWDQEQTVNHQRGIPMTDVRAYLEKTKLGETGDVAPAA